MSETNNKILLGTVLQSIDKKKIIGNNFNKNSIILLDLIINNITYCTNQYNATKNQIYFDKLKVLNEILNKLKYNKDICKY